MQVQKMWQSAKHVAPSHVTMQAQLFFSKPWIDVFALPEKFNMSGTESDPDPKVLKISITL